MVGDMQRRRCIAEQRLEPLLAFDIGQLGQILALQLEQVEGVVDQRIALALLAMPAFEQPLQRREIGIAGLVVGDDLAPDFIIPSVFDPRVLEQVAPAVSAAAIADGVIRGRV